MRSAWGVPRGRRGTIYFFSTTALKVGRMKKFLIALSGLARFPFWQQPGIAYPVTVAQACDREGDVRARRKGSSNDVNLTEIVLVVDYTDWIGFGYTGIFGLEQVDRKTCARVRRTALTVF